MNTASSWPNRSDGPLTGMKRSTTSTAISTTTGCPICASFPRPNTPENRSPKWNDSARKCPACGTNCGRPALLDLFCGAGGAARGYQRAGFCVLGVDVKPQPHYAGCRFHQGDALTFPLEGFDAIHASPPCQAFSSMSVMPNARRHEDLLTPTRSRLVAAGVPYVIENVPGSPIDVRPVDLFGEGGGICLCGSMFGLCTDEYELRRHRWFESNVHLAQPQCRHTRRTVVGFYGDHARTRRHTKKLHNKDAGGDITKTAQKLALVDALMGIDWMPWDRATQAIPPAYTEYIGRQILLAVML